ncbi:serine hydrolase [Ideonella sp. 4Y11]|uniref:Serine hydrolase n=1 Tax=Ideonella aquatica TaxID=2824119 RepID=A0A940YED6_9BURK|nr:serine hydrolase [Ideonella aquatica]MBQ0958610.1 serine hydrolase [Ideonella aquatica]
MNRTLPPTLVRRPGTSLILCAMLAALAGAADARRPSAQPSLQGEIETEGQADDLDALGDVGAEAMDPNSNTDDHSVNVPTSWWTYTNQTAAQVSSLLSSKGARLVGLDIYGIVSGAPRFTVRMVRNSGAYAVPGWWWYYGLTAADIATQLSTNNARLIELKPYDAGGGVIRYAAIMVSNTSTAARAWSYLVGVSSSQISTHLTNTGHRLIDLDTYTVGGVKKYTAVMVANTGADAKSWQWWLNQSPASVATRVASFSGRIVKLVRNDDGTYNFIQVKNTGSNNSAWWYQYGFTSLTDLNNYALQVASRPVDLRTYVDSNGVRRYDAAFIDNANSSTRRMRSVFGATFLDGNGNPTRGIFEGYLKLAGGAVKVDLNSARRAETASSLKALHLLTGMQRVQAGTDTLASAFNYYQYDPVKGKDACPDPAKETVANLRTDYNFETGLDEMMRISDNRTTRGTVLRYGGFSPFNTVATNAGLSSTTLRHNIGCAYRNPATGKYSTALRNDTSAADLARIYEGVWNSTLLNNTNSARSEFLESANPGMGASSRIQTIINEEAAALGKSAVAASFGSAVRSWSKGGSYGTCLPDGNGNCGQQVIIRSGAGLMRLPIKVSGVLDYRTYSYGHLISDTPVPCWEDYDAPGTNCQADVDYTNAHGNASAELFRDEIRSALQTW